MSNITLCVTSLNPDENKLNKMLASAVGFEEILLHIDAGTKNYPDIDFKNAGSRIRMIDHPEHLEIGPAYDMLVKEVKTEWVCVFFDDDYFDVEGLRQMIQQVNNNPDCDIAHFQCTVGGYMPLVDRRGLVFRFFQNIVAPYLKKKYLVLDIKYLLGCQSVSVESLEKDNGLPAGSFFKKYVWEKVGGFKGRITHDWIFWLRSARMGFRFKYFDYVVYHYIRRQDSAWFKQLKQECGGNWKKCRETVLREAEVTWSRSGRVNLPAVKERSDKTVCN
jgi:hypothetical protein